ncbi:uncharacterized protein LOC110942954 [Helianthus annuus]|uniref:uncharacterized protein LOC110942954 n=1 Tax=Helianthus annuus TaxID=4232 RepID=UPI000B8F6FEC|nr:uncharacterized protein LOC110942954 [Helianthus annuus]
MGDFNSALNLEDQSMGTSSISVSMREFQACLNDIEVFDINRSGFHFTWNQKPKEGIGLLKKIDRVLGNTAFVVDYPSSVAVFNSYRLSDHCLCILKIPKGGEVKRKSFKFANFLVFKPEFIKIVQKYWETNIDGVHQFRVVKRLRLLKSPLRALLFQQGNLHRDMNTAFFHSTLKNRNYRSRTDVIKDADGIVYEGDQVHSALVKHYEKFLGGQDEISLTPTRDLFSNKLQPEVASYMVHQVTEDEVKNAMFSIGIDKVRVLMATPAYVTDYRPIACCNVLYKCISKIIADRIKVALNGIVSVNQSAFVPGRKISDNILLTQELMHNYHRNSGPPRCAFKVDIQKAYDTVDWSFLKSTLLGFGFNSRMVDWIMVCVGTPSFSVCVNGNVHGYFRGQRGLRQGDPISPYLFTLVMEILTAILKCETSIDSSFRFHNRCERQQIINLCFADDLFMFARGDVNSAKCIMSSLTIFSNMSGLIPSIPKSTVFFCNVPNNVKQSILNILPFVERSLPVRYLGVPLISSRLLYKDCNVLIEKLDSPRVIRDLEARMRNYLWSQDASFRRGKAKVSWKSVCLPKFEGGLEIRRIGDINKALMANHI